MKEISDLVACVSDRSKIFLPVALKLAEQYKKVYWTSPSNRDTVKEGTIGDGFDNIERVDSVWDVKKDCDLFAFMDIGLSGEQLELESQGFPVWGSRKGDSLEINRGKFLSTIKSLGLDVPKYVQLRGLTSLREHLKSKNDKWVKVDSKWRGDCETFHWRDWDQDETTLDIIAVKLGPVKDLMMFYVFDTIETDIEDGIDTFCIDGRLPAMCAHGMELKNCYDSKTEVLTDTGWKLFMDLDGSESVLTLNISNSRYYKVEYQKPTDYIRDVYTGKMLSLESDNYSLLVTPNHNLLMQVNTQGTNRAKVTWKGTDGVFRTFRQGTRNRKLVRASDIDFSKWQSMPWPTSGYFSGAGKLRPRFVFGGIRVNTRQFARFLGLYLSEGWTNGKRIVVAQKKYCLEVESVLKDCSFRYSKSNNRGCTNYAISNRPLASYLFQFGKSSDKHVPRWLKMADWRVIDEFLHWYCVGDGSFLWCEKQTRGKRTTRVSRRYSTISRQMADDIQELMAKRGRQSIIAETAANGKPKFVITERVVQHKNYVLPQHSKWVDYSGEIFCVTVPNHIILVRRNGKPLWCGNSAYLGTMAKLSDIPEEVRRAAEAFAPVLGEFGYRGFFSTEVRIAGDKSYFTDPTLRAGSPPSQVLTELFANLGEIIWAGANGECIDPEPAAKFGAQVLLKAGGSRDAWSVVSIPDKIKQWVKCGGSCQVDGRIGIPPDEANGSDIGWLVAIGDTITGLIETLQEHAKALPDGITCDLTSLAELIEEIHEAEAQGMEFTDQRVPEPAIVTETNGE